MILLADDSVLQRAVDKNWLRLAQLGSVRASRAGRGSPVSLVEAVVAEKLLTPWQVAQLRAEELGLSTVYLASVNVTDDVRDLVPRQLAERHQLVPLTRDGRTLRVAVADPLESEGIDELRQLLGWELEIEACLAPTEEIRDAINRLYDAGSNGSRTGPVPVSRARVATDDALSDKRDGPIITLVHEIILEAIRRRASDVHLEPLAQRFRVRYRVDGVLIEGAGPPKRLQLAVVSRLKIMANISIAERRIPQDGRIQITLGDRSLDLRVSSLPTAHGESIVMRLLDRADLRLGLSELGFWADDQARFEQLIGLPNGLMLVTGPTGSGKTTTLYGCLHHLNQADRKILTVEDPVEYQLSGINQVPVRHEFGVTFSSALRAMLRQAPNVIMVGEIRDRETADIAINAALTGHMVFSTLHTNDAIGAIARLGDIGVKPFLLSAALRAVVAQRLVRRICGHCRQPQVPAAAELAALGLTRAQAAAGTLRRGVGCPECAGTGYRGRVGIFELLAINGEISQMIHERRGSARLRDTARAQGMRTLREDGARKVIAGLTTIEEVVSITLGDTS